MVRYKQAEMNTGKNDSVRRTESPGIIRAMAKLQAKYGKYAVPLIELRKRLGKEMGEKTLTDELYAMLIRASG